MHEADCLFSLELTQDELKSRLVIPVIISDTLAVLLSRGVGSPICVLSTAKLFKVITRPLSWVIVATEVAEKVTEKRCTLLPFNT